MDYFDQSIMLEKELKGTKREVLRRIRDEHGLEGEDLYQDLSQVESALYDGSIDPSWEEARDYAYADEALGLQSLLIKALQTYEKHDRKSLHNANKAFEELVRQCRGARRNLREDVLAAQRAIEVVEGIIAICDDLRR